MRPWTARGPCLSGRTRPCFNGATALRPWTAQPDHRHSTADLLQWGHGLAAVDGSTGPIRPPPPPSRFNGATALRPWTAGMALGRIRTQLRLQWGHGLAAVDGPCSRPLPTSMYGLQWGHGLAAVDGAPPDTRLGAEAGLQWGHGLAAVDGGAAQDDHLGRLRLQWGHGLAAVDGVWPVYDRTVETGFNGATALRPWTGGAESSSCYREIASMGPRPCGRGRSSWVLIGRRPHWASMGPRPCGRGRRLAATQVVPLPSFNGATALRPWTAMRRACRPGEDLASMGPRPCGRGRRRRRGSSAKRRRRLQWGHGLAAVDGAGTRTLAMPLACFNGATALRPWTANTTMRFMRGMASFNGATALRPWTGDDRHGDRRRLVASMGPRPCGRGRDGADLCLDRVLSLQWGHGLAAVDGSTSRPRRCAPSGFNGATALRPWTDGGVGEVEPAGFGFNGATALRPWTAPLGTRRR